MERAIAERNKVARDPGKRFDEVWCVFDCDGHDRIDDAFKIASLNKIRIALSNPCIELWVLLHLQDHFCEQTSAGVQATCKQLLQQFEKRIPFDQIHPRYQDAVRRAKSLAEMHERNGKSRTSNPSTGVYELTEEVLAAVHD